MTPSMKERQLAKREVRKRTREGDPGPSFAVQRPMKQLTAPEIVELFERSVMIGADDDESKVGRDTLRTELLRRLG